MATGGLERSISTQERDLLDIKSEISPVEHRDLQPGDHIVTGGKFLGMKYYHHGIFLGHDEGVVHFGTTKLKIPEKLRCVVLGEFTSGRPLCRVEYPTETCSPPKTTVTLARELKDNPDLWGPYNIETNNCEHFAMRCKTGKHVSQQSVKAMRGALERTSLKVAKAFSGFGR